LIGTATPRAPLRCVEQKTCPPPAPPAAPGLLRAQQLAARALLAAQQMLLECCWLNAVFAPIRLAQRLH